VAVKLLKDFCQLILPVAYECETWCPTGKKQHKFLSVFEEEVEQYKGDYK
jgi:hypothetical protein